MERLFPVVPDTVLRSLRVNRKGLTYQAPKTQDVSCNGHSKERMNHGWLGFFAACLDLIECKKRSRCVFQFQTTTVTERRQ